MKMLDLDTETAFPKKYMETALGFFCVYTQLAKNGVFSILFVCFSISPEKNNI